MRQTQNFAKKPLPKSLNQIIPSNNLLPVPAKKGLSNQSSIIKSNSNLIKTPTLTSSNSIVPK
jgi:hypothetical protein